MSAPEGNTAIRLYEAKFRDAITAVLSAAIRPDRPVETHLAESLRRLFLCAPVHVIWRTRTEIAAASAPDLRSPADVIRDPARVRAILELADPLATARAHPRVTVNLTAEDAPAFGMLLTSGSDSAQLWIVLEGPRAPLSRDLLTWFAQYSQGLVEFFSAVRSLMALKAVQRDAAYSALARRADAVVQGTERSFGRDLEAGARILSELVETPDALDTARVELALNLAVWAAQALLGIGPAGRPVDGVSGQLKLEAFADLLERIARRAEVEVVGRPSEASRPAELAALAGILRATLPSDAVIPARIVASTAVDPALHLLVSWTRMHELARRVAEHRRPPRPDDDLSWNEAANAAIPDLAALLEQRSFALDGRSTFVRNWARLWFCHLLLRASQIGQGWWQGGLLDDDKWRFRRDLSYALRESVRYLVYGARDDYRFQPGAFADALRTLVEQHALRVVGLPREVDVRTHLREIGDPAGSDGYHFAAGHLQHILEIYIGGHFLSSLRVKVSEQAEDDERALDGWSMAEVLASRAGWRPGAQTTSELVAAFSLAALFHDTGMLLFPRYSRPSEPVVRGDSRLESCLGDVERSFRAAGSQLIERCVEDLRGADYLDTNADPGLARWLDDQLQSGAPDHALLGAWYLHRVSRGLTGTSTEVIREALRAILLHSLPALTIDVERDPVAGLLVLCDELFEWEPFVRPGPAQQAPGRSIAVMASDVRARQSRTVHVALPGLAVHARAGGELDATLELGPADLRAGWPRVQLKLFVPERLEMQPHFIWLAIGQNLCRIERSRYGWGPSVAVSGAIPARLRAAGLNTRRLLGQIAVHSRHPARVSLERWLFDVGVFSTDDTEGTERVVLEARNHVMHSEDIRRAFRALDEDAERVLQEFERRLRQA